MEKIKVLLVEDEPTLAMIIKDTLDGNEFDITLAANGEGPASSRYAEINPDIIVSGYHDAQDGWFHDGQIDP